MPEPLREGGVPQGLGFHTPRLPRLMFEGVHTPASAAAPMIAAAGERHRWWMSEYPHLATFGVMVRDRATGSLRGEGLSRRLDYRLHDDDARDLGAGVLLIADALFRAGAERVLLPLAGGEPEVASPDELSRRRPEDFTPSNLMTSAFHPQGSAGVGRVVDPDLRLLGSARIFVADGSVLPDSPGVNPQITIMGFALRLADHLREH
jgi:choline dehydrogenase-like flavoprotein